MAGRRARDGETKALPICRGARLGPIVGDWKVLANQV